MKLIGMLDSPYVRRVAITLECMEVSFEHQALSVFKDYKKFKLINPAVKAPTLICDDGEVMMDSSLILQYVDKLYPDRSLWSPNTEQFAKEIRVVSFVSAACEKAVQIYYEMNVRSRVCRDDHWLQRITEQLCANLSAVEQALANQSDLFAKANSHPAIATAVMWRFFDSLVSEYVAYENNRYMRAHSEKMESQQQFLKYPPIGPGVLIAPSEPIGDSRSR